MRALVPALLTVLVAGPAWACPVCGASEGAGFTTLAVVGGMIAIPYAVAAVAIKVIRRADAETAAVHVPPAAEQHSRGDRP